MRATKPAFVAEEQPHYFRPLAFYAGRLEAFHAVLHLTCPGQPRFGELQLRAEDGGESWEAALYAVYRRLGSALSRLSLEQREELRSAAIELSRSPPRPSRLANPLDPDYCLALSMAYRQIIAALDMRNESTNEPTQWLV